MSEWANLPDSFWSYVDQGQIFDARVGPSAKQHLSSFIDATDYELAFSTHDPGAINLRLRQIIPRYLLNKSSASTCASWIIGEWGGIRTGLEWLDFWLVDLQNFSPDAVDLFVSRHGMERVSSWSKLLAFAKPTDYAIYDAKVATSLNCALRHFGDDRQFAVPASQVNEINQYANTLPRPHRKRGYLDYLALLRERVRQYPTTDILCSEMLLFANWRPLLLQDGHLNSH